MTSQSQKQCKICQELYPGQDVTCPHKEDQYNQEIVLSLTLTGQTIAERYQIERELGRGGMGIIYLARDLTSPGATELVALKILATNAQHNETMRSRFLAEAKAASSLNHSNIVKVRDFAFSKDGLPFMVMDYIQGQSLSQLLEAGQIDSIKAVNIAIDICTALAHAHNRRVIHRDIKPSNIMICGDIDNNFKTILLDFGIAKIFSEPGEVSLRLTETEQLFGSPLYMSPEQCMGQNIDNRSDIYSLACVLYECLTGSSPFRGDNFLNVIFRHVNEQPQPFAAKAPYKSMQSVIFRALNKKPADRYNNMTEFRQNLEHCLNDLIKGAKSSLQANLAQYSPVIDNTQDHNFLQTFELARGGFAPAQLDLACLYEDGIAVGKDLEEAFNWCLKAASQGLTEAQVQLGDYFKLGIGTEVEPAKSAYWYKKAALSGHAGAMHGLGFYHSESGPEPDIEQSLEWYKKAAMECNEQAQFALGLVYILGQGVEEDAEEAAKWFEMAAQQGHGESQYQIGMCYEHGNGVDLNQAKAFKWYKLAAEQGLAAAQCLLACMYEFGEGTEIDIPLAIQWMNEASSNGHEWADLYLSNWYTFGQHGLPVDYARSLKLLRRAAQADVGPAMHGLGKYYLNGMGVVKDAKTAAHWFKQSVETGYTLAMYELARLYLDGYGVKQDEQEGLKLMEAAALDEIDAAQYELGLYYKKLGALDQAELWLKRAQINNHPDATDALSDLRNNNKDIDT
ncbi:MAG: SEL1-like repeat protein [Candidatus Obscuribacter sp.]|nr:SEL1-like repeat protein [Candidatus Obscuribacter sp.]